MNYKNYPRPPRIRVSARQWLRVGGSSTGGAGRACDDGLAGWWIQRKRRWSSTRRLPPAWRPCRNLLPLLVPSARARSRGSPGLHVVAAVARRQNQYAWVGWSDASGPHDDAWHAGRGSGGIQRRRGAALTDMRARGSSGILRGRGAARGSGRRGRAVPAWTERVRGGRTTSSRLAKGRAPSQATHLRWDRWRRTSLGASCDDGLP
jgi:hypothetical protein